MSGNGTTCHAPPSGSAVLESRRAQEVTASGVLLWAAGTLLAYCVYEQLSFYLKRRKADGSLLKGPKFAVPLLGCIIEMVMDPFGFWDRQREAENPGLTYNSIVGKFMVMVNDTDVMRKVFSVNEPSSLLMAVHPSAKNILGPANLAFMHGPAHKAIRRSFLALFTKKALATYVQLQDGIIRRHLADWMWNHEGKEFDIKHAIRDMNAATSQGVFAGPYLTDEKERAKFSDAFIDMTKGFLAFPICLPGTAVWKGYKGRLFILTVLKRGAGEAKAAMKAGGEARCLMDFWAQRCLEEIAEAEVQGVPPPGHTSDHAMADTVMDFLFASQDASTASLTWVMTLMADHPDILDKVREEQARVRPDPAATITGEVLYQMTYTRAVVREILRFRPPAPMVPQIAQAPFQLTEDYTAPKGTLIMPSITAAAMHGFTDAHTFDPDRFSEERKEDLVHGKHFLTFGFGPHGCVGREYAINHLVAFLAVMSTDATWTRRRTSKSDDWLYLPTVYPADSWITLHRRS
mmetsp:Transcript_6661/g.19183  ORF Transcript_6661/g.19183 Transcript_6661/m.19183 type:complete len:518 (+) Transcript_6661:369-1922(+)